MTVLSVRRFVRHMAKLGYSLWKWSTTAYAIVVLGTVVGCGRSSPPPRSATQASQQGRLRGSTPNTSAPARHAATELSSSARRSDIDYYRSRASALATLDAAEIGRTDFARFRRGHLFAQGVGDPSAMHESQRALMDAANQENNAALLDMTSKILVDDPANIDARILRAMALQKSTNSTESDFHRQVAKGLISSIMRTGDGTRFETAWKVYSVREEYLVLEVLGCDFVSQSLMTHEGHPFDVLEARTGKGGETIHVYFDITELMAEEQRMFTPGG